MRQEKSGKLTAGIENKMSLTKVIAGDLKQVGLFARGGIKGAFHGLYTPAFLTTGLANLKNADNYAERSGHLLGQAASTVISQVAVVYYMHSIKGIPAYLIALAFTNICDYMLHAKTRAKK